MLGCLTGKSAVSVLAIWMQAGGLFGSGGMSGRGSLAVPNLYCPSGLTLIYGDRQTEGLGPMSLPSNYPSLTPAEQLFVLTDLERVDRGLAPIEGLSTTLNAYAQAGANGHRWRQLLGPPGHHPRVLRRPRPHGGRLRLVDHPGLRRW